MMFEEATGRLRKGTRQPPAEPRRRWCSI